MSKANVRLADSMPHLLFIAYPFPPTSVSGANRTWPLAKYLARMGWTVTVVSAREASFSRQKGVREMQDACRREGVNWITVGTATWSADSPDAVVPAWQRLCSLMRRAAQGVARRAFRLRWDDLWSLHAYVRLTCRPPMRPDVVLATGMPFSSFLLARILARRFQVPYVLDYRDPWSANPYWAHDGRSTVVQRLEYWALSHAYGSTMVSPSQADAQHDAFADYPRPTVITNGFDPEQLGQSRQPAADRCTIIYAGILYPGKRDIDPVLNALHVAHHNRSSHGRPFEFRYYGAHAELVRQKVSEYQIDSLSQVRGQTCQADVLSAISRADVCVVITGMQDRAGAAERGIVTGKIFEALGLGIPILLISPRDSDARQILQAAGSSGCAFCASEVDAMAEWLTEVNLRPPHRNSPPDRFSWPVLAKDFDRVLRKAIHSPSGCTPIRQVEG